MNGATEVRDGYEPHLQRLPDEGASSRFSGGRPVQFFDSDKACFRYKAAVVVNSGPAPFVLAN